MKIIKSKYGNKLKSFEFDYLGGHDGIDGILLNGDVSLLKKGILISTTLSNNFAFIEWNKITELRIIRRKSEHINIIYDKGIIELERVKEEVDLNKFISIITENSSNVKVEYTEDEYLNVIDLNFKRYEINILEQERRIEKFVGRLRDEIKILNKWEIYLKENLKFPFQAEVAESEDSSVIREGDKVKVINIDYTDDLYGVLVEIRLKRKKYYFPLCDLEGIDLDDLGSQAVDDYRTWFANR